MRRPESEAEYAAFDQIGAKEIQMPGEQEAILSCDDCGKHLLRYSRDSEYWHCDCSLRRITNFGAERYYPESRVQELEGERDRYNASYREAIRLAEQADEKRVTAERERDLEWRGRKEEMARAQTAESHLARLQEALREIGDELGELTRPPWVEGLTPLIAEVRDTLTAADAS